MTRWRKSREKFFIKVQRCIKEINKAADGALGWNLDAGRFDVGLCRPGTSRDLHSLIYFVPRSTSDCLDDCAGDRYLLFSAGDSIDQHLLYAPTAKEPQTQ